MKSVHLIIHGQVQGVYFRQSARDKALELEIAGTAQNKKDGTVEIFAEGSIWNIEIFIAWCKQGPKSAKVERIDINECPLKNFRDFVIVH